MRPDELSAFLDGLAAWAADGVAAVTSSYGPHEDQVVDLHLPGKTPALGLAVVLHGGFWRPEFTRQSTAALAVALASEGWASANVEYRRLGPGAYRPLLEDVAAASAHIAWPERRVAIGHSAGGHLALWLAAVGAVDAALGLGAVCDLEDAFRHGLGGGAVAEFLGGAPEEIAEAYDLADPGRRLPLERPQLLVHGRADDRVPIDHARRYAARAEAAGDHCRVIEVEVGHFEPIDPRSAVWLTIVEAMETLA